MKQKNPLGIFIAEDEPITLAGYKLMIKEIGHEVVGEANDGKTALENIIAVDPDLIIIDINLPQMDGITVLERVFKIKLYPSIIITGYKDQNLIDRANKTGAFCYLQKPVNEYDINSMINIVMSRFEEVQSLKKNLGDVKNALAERKTIERAKGIIMDKYNYKENQAMKYLQEQSKKTNKKLFVVSEKIIKENSNH